MCRNFGFNLASQGAFDFDKQPILRESVRRTTQPRVITMLNDSDLVSFTTKFSIIKISNERFQKSPMGRRGVSGPLRLQDLFTDECLRSFVTVIAYGTRGITGRNHILSDIQPFLRPLFGVRSRDQLTDSADVRVLAWGVHLYF